jgi:ornithine cyclodeaminase/alanine dehydrogenase-like protein (mu-crystallin family)
VPRVRAFDEIRVANRTRSRAEELAAAVGGVVAGSFEEAVRGADVICLCTDATEPLVQSEWIGSGAHLSATGSARGNGDLDAALLDDCVLVVESRVAFNPMPMGAPELAGRDPDSAAELGEVIAGTRPGRTDPEQRTVYKSMGHALEDATAARLIYDAARAAGRGQEIDISA